MRWSRGPRVEAVICWKNIGFTSRKLENHRRFGVFRARIEYKVRLCLALQLRYFWATLLREKTLQRR